MKVIGWVALVAGLGLAGADVFYAGFFLLWTGLGIAAFGVLVLALGHVARRPPERIARPHAEGAAPARGPSAAVGQSYRALTRFAGGHGRIRVGTASVGAQSDDAIGPGDTVDVIAITDGQPTVRKRPPSG